MRLPHLRFWKSESAVGLMELSFSPCELRMSSDWKPFTWSNISTLTHSAVLEIQMQRMLFYSLYCPNISCRNFVAMGMNCIQDEGIIHAVYHMSNPHKSSRYPRKASEIRLMFWFYHFPTKHPGTKANTVFASASCWVQYFMMPFYPWQPFTWVIFLGCQVTPSWDDNQSASTDYLKAATQLSPRWPHWRSAAWCQARGFQAADPNRHTVKCISSSFSKT